MKRHHVGLSTEIPSLGLMLTGLVQQAGCCLGSPLVRCSLNGLEFVEEALTSEGTVNESQMGGQCQDPGIVARGGVVGWGRHALCSDTVLLARGISHEHLGGCT